MNRRSEKYPPSTGFKKPDKPGFYVWRDPFIRYTQRKWARAPWRWCCTLCEPPSFGFRSMSGAWAKIIGVSMPNHFASRATHHRHVARARQEKS